MPFLIQHLQVIEDNKADVEQARVLYDAVYKADGEDYIVNSGKWRFSVTYNSNEVVVRNEKNQKSKKLAYYP